MPCPFETKTARSIMPLEQDVETPQQPTHLQKCPQKPAAHTDVVYSLQLFQKKLGIHQILLFWLQRIIQKTNVFWMKARERPKCQQLCEIYNFMLCWTPWLPLLHFFCRIYLPAMCCFCCWISVIFCFCRRHRKELKEMKVLISINYAVYFVDLFR